ncbi:MAG: N-acetylmuramoyl-L-alanine amidase [Deltaproteobacteria bacterium]|nr:N-acetylmuramoyl-L-alanine amidase [Deltaproteobacteria bacterium]MBN2686883.1 N-acetylmuramoyl-L-alanine amidase [Deltaproteobacteria bacterium]
MERRRFLSLLGKGFLVSSVAGVFPTAAFGKTALDYALEGQNYLQNGDYNKALEALLKAVEIDPQSDWAYGLLGRTYRGLNKNAEAVDAFRKAVRLNPEDVYSRMMIEIITQKPIPRLKSEPEELTPLEITARQEESAMLTSLRSDEGLGYKVNRVVIDPGHGGFDSGALGYSGLKEKDVTLDLAIMLYQRMASQGKIKPFLTRTADYYVPLSDRTAIANQFQADLFLSIHINASKNRNARGSETYYCSEKASNQEAARVASLENAVLKYDKPLTQREGYIDIEEILFRFEQKMNWKESGVFAGSFQQRFREKLPLDNRGVNAANFFVLRRAKMPSILLEIGFISNAEDEERLKGQSFRERVVESIMWGLL